MGCMFSQSFEVQEGVPGQDEYAMEIFDKLHLEKRDIDKFYAAFSDMDADTSRYIRRDEFCAYFNLEKTPLTVKMVKMMDTEHHGCLDFSEMVALLWDFLSRDTKSLGSFAFHLIDEKNTGMLNADEVTGLIEMLHHTTTAKSKAVKNMVAAIVNKMTRSTIDVETFHEYCQVHDEVCLSLFGLQNSLRERILGLNFWGDIVLKRNQDEEQVKPNYVQSLFASVKEEKELKLKGEVESSKAKREKRDRRRSSLIGLFFEKDRGQRKAVYKIPQRKRITRQNSHGKAPPDLAHKSPSTKKKSKKSSKKSKISPTCTETETSSDSTAGNVE